MPVTPYNVRKAVRTYSNHFDRTTVVLPPGTKKLIREELQMNVGPYIYELVAKDFTAHNLPFESPIRRTDRLKTNRSKLDDTGGLEQISLNLPRGTKQVIMQAFGMKASPYMAELVRIDLESRGFSVDFQMLKHKNTVVIDKSKTAEMDTVCELYLHGYTEQQIAEIMGGDWNAENAEYLIRGASYQEGDLYETVQIERQRRIQFVRRHQLKEYPGYPKGSELDDRLFFAGTSQRFKKDRSGKWHYRAKSDYGGVTVSEDIEVQAESLERKLELAWKQVLEENRVKWLSVSAGQDLMRAYRVNRMLAVMNGGESIKMTVDSVEISRTGSCVFHFLDGSEAEIGPSEEG